MVEDPPHLVRAQQEAKHQGIDFLGLVLIGTALGALQVVLDTGERHDWFGSSMIVFFTILTIAALIVFVVWEWRQPHPVINLKLFKNRSFASASALMFSLGLVMYGSVVLIPQFLQVLMGYSAQLAGEVLSPGGFAIMLLMPVVGLLVSRVDPRYLVTVGFVLSGLALLQLMQINLNVDFTTAVTWRMFQAVGLAFLFVPINTLSFAGVPPRQNNQVSAIMNLMRNLGGSVGISAVTTLLTRYGQRHQHDLVANLYGSNPTLLTRLEALSRQLHARGASSFAAMNQAYGQIYGIVQRQAMVLSYIDAFWIMAIICFAAIPLVFIARRPETGHAAMGH
jgi:MFS transporter, DHA2 family, multidrug resistance protein